jgi:hypothetical protein
MHWISHKGDDREPCRSHKQEVDRRWLPMPKSRVGPPRPRTKNSAGRVPGLLRGHGPTPFRGQGAHRCDGRCVPQRAADLSRWLADVFEAQRGRQRLSSRDPTYGESDATLGGLAFDAQFARQRVPVITYRRSNEQEDFRQVGRYLLLQFQRGAPGTESNYLPPTAVRRRYPRLDLSYRAPCYNSQSAIS